MDLELAKVFAAAFLGALGAFTVQWVKSARDELKAVCEEYCTAIAEAVDLASEYWLTGPPAELKLFEAKLIGFQAKLAGFSVLTSEQFAPDDKKILEQKLPILFDAMTGGEFEVPARVAHFARARVVQQRGADLALAVRIAFKNSIGIREILARKYRRIYSALKLRS